MSRNFRANLAEQTLRIIEDRGYVAANGIRVDLGEAISSCIEGTRFYAAEDIAQLREKQRDQHDAAPTAKLEVVNETTLAGLGALLEGEDSPVAVLNLGL